MFNPGIQMDSKTHLFLNVIEGLNRLFYVSIRKLCFEISKKAFYKQNNIIILPYILDIIKKCDLCSMSLN